MNDLLQHLPVLPIVVPLIVGSVLLLLSESQRAARLTLVFASVVVQLTVSVVMLYLTTDAAPWIWADGVGVYSIGGWAPPFGIVLVVDRLSALMVTLTATVALAATVYATAHWDRPGQPFLSLNQFLLMGLNGAFLTGDIFNLFVFFEVLLAASYGLLLRGVGRQRVRKTLHYIAVNITASVLFLIGVAIIYGTLGTLTMADVLGQVSTLAPEERSLFNTGAAILGVAFLVKAGAWPLNFWLPSSYSAAVPPVSAAFALMTKVGIYAALRVGTLMGEDQAAAAILGPTLFYLGLATLVAGTIGMLATQQLARLVSYTVIMSSGLLLAALGLGLEQVTAPALFYLVVSVLTTAAFFMLTGMTDRTRLPEIETDNATPEEALPPLPAYVAFGVDEPRAYATDEEVGVAVPAAMAFLGLMFICCVLLVCGLPPLPGFIAKITLLSAALAWAPEADLGPQAWVLAIGVLATGFAGVLALSRIGIRLFWTGTRRTPRLRVLEAAPVAVLVALCMALTVASGPAMQFFEAAAQSLHQPDIYTRTVLPAGPGAALPSEAQP